MRDNVAVITGLGVISAAGTGLAANLASLKAGLRNAGPTSLFETSLRNPVFEVKGMPAGSYPDGQRTLHLARMAVSEALDDAWLKDSLHRFRVGVCLGTTVASQLNDLDFYSAYRSTGSARMEPVERYLKGNLAEAVSRIFNASGPALTVVNACSSGADAIGVALSFLRNDLCDIAVAGGADELSRIPLCGFASLGIASGRLCAPFDKDRSGLNLGEGAGVIILEKRQTAADRGMMAGVFLAGYGAEADAYHLTAPHPEGRGLRSAINAALEAAGVEPRQIDFVNAHGTGTRDNDLVEGKVISDIFGAGIKMLSTKGFTGHTLGAAGGIEAVFTAAALREQWIPASIGFINRDDAIPVTPVMEPARINSRYAISTSLAFGGNNAALVFGRMEQTA